MEWILVAALVIILALLYRVGKLEDYMVELRERESENWRLTRLLAAEVTKNKVPIKDWMNVFGDIANEKIDRVVLVDSKSKENDNAKPTV